MITERGSEFQVTGSLPGEKIAMGVNLDAMAHIISILTNLYSNIPLAVIREYSTNAADAHIEAGQRRPIEISLPSALSPYFRVKDFGVGMSAEDIRTIYSQYGASTKRSTNAQGGKFGIGGKAALAYTNQFTLTAGKAGRQVQVVIARDDDGAGSMTVVYDEPTGAPNGVEIVVPVKSSDIGRFSETAKDFFRFWEKGSVLVNGAAPQTPETLRVSDSISVIEGSASYVVMANVPYPLTSAEATSFGLRYNYGVVVRVAIGSVDITPSREALMYTAKTNATLAALRRTFKAGAQAAVQADIDAQPSPPAGLAVWKRWHRVFSQSSTNYTYKGEVLPDVIKWPEVVFELPRNSYTLSRHSKADRIYAQVLPGQVWFHGYDTTKAFSAPKRKKLNHWLGENGMEPAESYVLCPSKPDCKWIDPAAIHSWDDVAAVKLPKTQTHSYSTRVPGSFDVWVDGYYKDGYPAVDIDQTKPIFYAEGGRRCFWPYVAPIADAYPDCTIMAVPGNRLPKFKRDFPTAKLCRDEIQAAYDKWSKALTDDQRLALTIQYSQSQDALKRLAPQAALILDPAITRAVRAAKLDITKLLEQQRSYQGLLGYGVAISDDWTNPLDAYPLLYNVRYGKLSDHDIAYLNWHYTASLRDEKNL